MKQKQINQILMYGIPFLAIAIFFYFGAQSSGVPGESIASQGNLHIDTIDSEHKEYSTTPPTSGPHVGSIARWGTFTEQVPDETFIHNMEDGGVILHYGPEANQEDIENLRGTMAGFKHTILHPYAGMSHKIVITAWGRILYLDEFDQDTIKSFIGAYHGVDHHK